MCLNVINTVDVQNIINYAFMFVSLYGYVLKGASTLLVVAALNLMLLNKNL